MKPSENQPHLRKNLAWWDVSHEDSDVPRLRIRVNLTVDRTDHLCSVCAVHKIRTILVCILST